MWTVVELVYVGGQSHDLSCTWINFVPLISFFHVVELYTNSNNQAIWVDVLVDSIARHNIISDVVNEIVVLVPLDPAPMEVALYQNPRLVSKAGSLDPRDLVSLCKAAP